MSNEIVDKKINVLLWSFQGCGKTTYAAASTECGTRRGGFAKSDGAYISLRKSKNTTLQNVADNIKKGKQVYMGTRRTTTYSYELLFKSTRNAWGQPLATLNLLDYRGGDFDTMQEVGVKNPQAAKQLQAIGNTINAIILLFSLEQFGEDEPLCRRNENRYHHRDMIYHFLVSVRNLVRGGNVPLVIAVNHCVQNGVEQEALIDEARESFDVWIGDVFRDVRKPNIYFIDSIEALRSGGKWRDSIGLPMLDLIAQFLDMAQAQHRKIGHTWVYGDTTQLQMECSKLIATAINAGGNI